MPTGEATGGRRGAPPGVSALCAADLRERRVAVNVCVWALWRTVGRRRKTSRRWFADASGGRLLGAWMCRPREGTR